MPEWLRKDGSAVITGGGNGIGRAAAQRFLNAGMCVLIADIDESALAESSAQLDVAAGELQTRVCDVSDYEQVLALADAARTTFGQIDCLMNNAGAGVTRALPWEDLEGWKKQLDINLWGIVHGCQAFVPQMLESQKPATVINTGSKQGITNPPGGFAYNLSKAGVLNYTQSLAYALRQTEACPVTAHLLVPGFTYSNMIARFMPKRPDGAWSCEQVVGFMLDALERNDFYIICPDNDTPRELDNARMQWSADDLIQNRPALSRWHPEYADAYEQFVAGTGDG
ncbi:MAG: SDR family NAD(P)-dependent oxidoreductase [Pseudomonadota bacterium]